VDETGTDDVETVARFFVSILSGGAGGALYGAVIWKLGASWTSIMIGSILGAAIIIVQHYSPVEALRKSIESLMPGWKIASLLVNTVIPIALAYASEAIFLRESDLSLPASCILFTMPAILSLLFVSLLGGIISSAATFVLAWYFVIPPNDSFQIASLGEGLTLLMIGIGLVAMFFGVSVQRSISRPAR
jgi:K+-sensing histidine kinase KdpD